MVLCYIDNMSYFFKFIVNIFMLIDIIIVVFCNVKIVKVVNVYWRKIVVKQEYVLRNFILVEKIYGGGVKIDRDKNFGNKMFNIFNLFGFYMYKKCCIKEQLEFRDNYCGFSVVKIIFVLEKY